MIINLEELAQMTAIAAVAGGGIRYIVVRPLQLAITALNESIVGLNDSIDNLKKDQHGIDKRLVAVEERAKSAHHRIDGLEEVVHK